MSNPGNGIRLRDLARGVLDSIPDTLTVQKGALGLLGYSLSADRRGSIGLVIEKLARKHPQAPALLFDDQRWTYAAFNAWANRVAGVLRARGIGSGDAVAILMPNRPEVLVCVTAAVKLGAVAAMLNHNQRGEVLAHSIKLTNPRLLIVHEECMEALESAGCTPAQDSSRTYAWDGEGKAPAGYLDLRAETARQGAANPEETQDVILRQPAFYIFTSGTTGMPKASVMTHHRWLRSMAGLGQMVLRLKRDDVLYCPLPLYHNNALTVSWGSALSAGAALALGRKFSASKFWDEVRRYNATAFCYIGEICRYLLNQPPNARDREHRVRLIVGNGLRAEIWEEFQERFGIARVNEFYGASESNLAFVNAFGLSRTAGFCPLTFAIVEYDAEREEPLRDAKGLMRKVAKGGTGLLISEVTERNPFDGYTDAGASEAKLLRNVFEQGDCWFNTGDLVRDQGFRHIQFVDRTGDTFRWKGENVATTEVEAALNGFAGVEEAVVYGVQLPGADGRVGMAALTLKAGKFPGAELARHLASQLPAYAVPLFLRLREAQEVTGTFKFRKVELKQQGYDLMAIDEPVYLLLDRARGYEPLTPALQKKIAQGEIRF